ncbi:MAG: BMP family ABC transporter substrate-binding protein [Nocardioides sp.]|nr:BMP family ABC transporter substrate-binding protein [Nocardioides sp.]
MRRLTKIAGAALVVALTATACSSDGDDQTGAGDQLCPAEGDGPKIGLAYDVGGRGDRSFNDLAAAGVTQSVDELDATCTELAATANEPATARAERLRQLAEEGHDPIVAAGFVYTPEVTEVAGEYPETSFAVVDGAAEGDNVTNLSFAPQEGSFLVGVAAGLKTETDQVGFIGGVENFIIIPFAAGFEAGVEAVNPDATVEYRWLSDEGDDTAFNNAPGGETAANALYDGGADIVFHAAGGSGAGLFTAAEEQDKLAIGVDSDQYLSAPESQQEHILTSALKRVDVAVFEFVQAFVEGDVTTGFDVYDLARDGVGYATSGGQLDDIEDELEDYRQQIVDGEIEVPSEF